MSTLQEDVEQLRKALLDLSYAFLDGIGLIRLAERYGMTLRPWVLERRNINDDEET